MVLPTCCMKCHHRNVSDLVPPCLCRDQLIQQLAHHQIASYKNQDDTDRLRFNWLRSSLSPTHHHLPPPSLSISLHLGFSLHRSPPGISLAGLPVKKKKKIPPSWSRHSRSQPGRMGGVKRLGLGGVKSPPPLPPSLSQATAAIPAHSAFLQLLTSSPQQLGER